MPTWPRSSKDVKGTLHAKEVWLKGNNQLRKTWQNCAIHQLEEPDFKIIPNQKGHSDCIDQIQPGLRPSLIHKDLERGVRDRGTCHGMPWRQLVASHPTASSNRSFFWLVEPIVPLKNDGRIVSWDD